ncbi:MAG TPA: hypothetical protein VFB27_06750, partial [Opitutaceae bacterium]|nr:hypothetical protein [Opitutaceae bacterium]
MPSPSDHLSELRRQRALVQEHLAWLDREIAAAAGETTPLTLAPKPPGPPAASASVANEEAEALLASY